MSKKNRGSVTQSLPPYEAGYLYWPWMAQELEGQILTAVESFGLKDTQEKAAKDVIRNYLYRFYDRVKYVPPQIVEKISEYNNPAPLTPRLN